MKIFTIGGNGLVGSRVATLLTGKYTFTDLSRSTGVDITKPDTLSVIAQDTEHEWVILYAAKTDVDGCEQDKSSGEDGEAWKLNVDGIKNVVEICKKANKKLFYISTDFVFDGEKGDYHEEDATKPINWYGVTKAKAEEIVQQSNLQWIITRISFPYTLFTTKKHFVQAIYQRLANGQPVRGVNDEIFSPTWIDDFSKSLDVLVAQNEKGIFHIGGNESVKPHEVAMKIAKTFNFDISLISTTTRAEYFAGKAPRPFNTSLNSDKIKKVGVVLTSMDETLESIKDQLTISKS